MAIYSDRRHDMFGSSMQNRMHKKSCSVCHEKNGCSCKVKEPTFKPAKLSTDCAVINALVGSKTVQKVAEITLPATAFGVADLDDIISIGVVPNLGAVTQNARIIEDKVVNIGLLPVTLTVTATGAAPVTITTALPFQEHTDFPGACPQDTLNESPLEVEGIFTQPGVPVVTGPAAGDLVLGILFKVVLRTTITVTRPVIVDGKGNVCDLNPNRCDNPLTTPAVINLPGPNGF